MRPQYSLHCRTWQAGLPVSQEQVLHKAQDEKTKRQSQDPHPHPSPPTPRRIPLQVRGAQVFPRPGPSLLLSDSEPLSDWLPPHLPIRAYACTCSRSRGCQEEGPAPPSQGFPRGGSPPPREMRPLGLYLERRIDFLPANVPSYSLSPTCWAQRPASPVLGQTLFLWPCNPELRMTPPFSGPNKDRPRLILFNIYLSTLYHNNNKNNICFKNPQGVFKGRACLGPSPLTVGSSWPNSRLSGFLPPAPLCA